MQQTSTKMLQACVSAGALMMQWNYAEAGTFHCCISELEAAMAELEAAYNNVDGTERN
jgi:hypothetical protein